MYCLVQCKSPGVLPGTSRPTLPPTDHSTGRVPSTGPDIPDLSTGAFSAFSLLSAFGQAVPLNLELQRRGRILPFPFHFLENTKAMNVYPKHYSWPEFYQHVVALSLRILLAKDFPPAAGQQRGDTQADERAASRILRRIRAYQVPFHDSSVARH